MNSHAFSSHSVQELARACARQASRSGDLGPGPSPCYEIFRRALNEPPDDEAWQAILDQYRRLVYHWLGDLASDDAVQEVFLGFWQAQRGVPTPFTARFPNIGAVMGYLKRCAATVRIEIHRERQRDQALQERLSAAAEEETILTRRCSSRGGFDFKRMILSKLKDPQERVVFEGSYYHNLPPREIQGLRPDLFPNVQRVYRVKENLLKRLARDEELGTYWQTYWSQSGEKGG